MNKLTLIILVFVLAMSTVAPHLPRHLNPMQVSPELPSGISLLMLYGSVIDAAIKGDFTNVAQQLGYLMKVHVPEDVKYIYMRFNELLSDELNKLNQTSELLMDARIKLSHGFLKEAEDYLEEARISIAEAIIIHSELEASSKELSRAFRISFPKLSNILEKLRSLISLYQEEISFLSDRLREFKERGILDTAILLWVNSSEAKVGSSIRVYGGLYDEYYHPLSRRNISIYIEDEKAASFITDEYGSFGGIIIIPYVYEPEVRLYAEYVPNDEDSGRFKASKSNIIILRLIYEEPSIIASLNVSSITPLRPFMIFGRVLTQSGIYPEKLFMNAFGKVEAINIQEDGSFKHVIKVPGTVSAGFHKITLYTKAHSILAPSQKFLWIKVYKIPVYLLLHVPTIALSGFQVSIRGELSIMEDRIEGSHPRGEIILELLEGRHAFKVENRTFSINLVIPMTSPTGFIDVTLRFNPDNPIYQTAFMKTRLLIINPLTILIPLSGMIYLMKISVSTFMKKKGKAPQATLKEAEVTEEVKPFIPRAGGIVEIYLEAVRIASEIAGIKMKPSDTIREFMVKVYDKLGGAATLFSELSYMTEAAIYGEIKPDIELARYILEGMRRYFHET